MDRHAEYAIAISISENTISDRIRMLYASNNHLIDLSFSNLSIRLFLGLPKVILKKANNNRFEFEVLAWGSLAVTTPDGTSESRNVICTLIFLVPPRIDLAGVILQFGFNSSELSLTTLNIQPFEGTAGFSAPVRMYIESAEVRNLIETYARLEFSRIIGNTLPNQSLSNFGGVVRGGIVTSVILDHALAIGIDINTIVAGVNIQTMGRPELLIDFTDGSDVALWVNPRKEILEVATKDFDIKGKMKREIENQGATFDENAYHFSIQEGSFHIAGRGYNVKGSSSFSFDAVPQLIRKGFDWVWSPADEAVSGGPHKEYWTKEEFWFEMQNIQVNVERAWWVVLVEVLTAGLGGIYIEPQVQEKWQDTYVSIANQSNKEISINLRLERFECHLEGEFIAISFKPQFSAGKLTGPSFFDADGLARKALTYKVELPSDFFINDPQLRVRWTIRRTDTNEIVYSSDRTAELNNTVSIPPLNTPFLLASEFTIECRVYRALGTAIEEVFSQTMVLIIYDRLDRRHPFVKWVHNVETPVVLVDAEGKHKQIGTEFKTRYSDIHRTDIPGRCLFASDYSWSAQLEYLDELPFPRNLIVVNRKHLCDYCFFGGPTKNIPLI